MKYIDADKLKAEIERLDEEYRTLRVNGTIEEAKAADLVVHVIHGLSNFIRSLQQEPRFPQYDNIVEKVFGAGNLEGWERDEAEMLVALAKEELLKSLQREEQIECSSSLVDFESTSADIKLRTCDKIEMEKLYGEEF